jgi:hypothetical protein
MLRLWLVKDLAVLVYEPTWCSEGPRGGCAFAWKDNCAYERMREGLDQTRPCPCISDSLLAYRLTFPPAKNRALPYNTVFSCPRLEYRDPEVWAEARWKCQLEGATMAVVNSEQEAEVLRSLYLKYGPRKVQRSSQECEIPETPDEPYEESPELPPPDTTPTPERTDAILHIGFHDIFIEGEYLTVRSK